MNRVEFYVECSEIMWDHAVKNANMLIKELLGDAVDQLVYSVAIHVIETELLFRLRVIGYSEKLIFRALFLHQLQICHGDQPKSNAEEERKNKQYDIQCELYEKDSAMLSKAFCEVLNEGAKNGEVLEKGSELEYTQTIAILVKLLLILIEIDDRNMHKKLCFNLDKKFLAEIGSLLNRYDSR